MLFETITISNTPSSLAITSDINSPHSFFVTHALGVVFVSLQWLPTLISEIAEPVEQGAGLRVEAFLNTAETLVERLLDIDDAQVTGQTGPVAAAIVLQDSDLGYFLLTAAGDRPWALTFDEPEAEREAYDPHSAASLVALPEVRQVYNPPGIFSQRTSLLSGIEAKIPARRRGLLAEPVVLSPATLDVMTEAHRVLSHETHLLGVAVSDLFRRCERLREELRDQVQRVVEIHERVVRLVDEGEDSENEDGNNHNNARAGGNNGALNSRAKLERRIHDAREKQRRLVARTEYLRQRVDGSSRGLSDREKTYAAEVERFDGSVSPQSKLLERFQDVQRYKEQLVQDAKAAAEHTTTAQAQSPFEGDDDRGLSRVPAEVRRQKKKEVEELLERQEALMEAAREKLERLGVAA